MSSLLLFIIYQQDYLRKTKALPNQTVFVERCGQPEMMIICLTNSHWFVGYFLYSDWI